MGQSGAKGDTGAAATVQVGNTNTGAPGTNAQVTNAGNEHFAVFNFTIPRGDKGETGATGAQGAKGDKGDKGDTGAAATIAVGSTTTTNPGTNATVINSGTTSAAVLNFGIPRGATGSVKSEVVSELPETGEGDTFYLVNREATTQTATGKAISFTNSENAGDITDAQIDGETSQNGTPTPSAPVAVRTVTGENVVKICGKNLFNPDTSKTYGYLDTNGKLYVSGGHNEACYDFMPVEENITYIFKIFETSDTIDDAYWFGIGAYSSASESGFISMPFRGITADWSPYVAFTTPQGCKYIRISGRYLLHATKVQLELGSTATAYEPYQEQSYEVNLGKNLFDKTAATAGARIGSNGSVITAASYSVSALIKVDGSANYTYSRGADGEQFSCYAQYKSDGTFISRTVISPNTSRSETITTASDAAYIRIADLTTSINTWQLEKGSQATPYAAYFEPIELCKIGTYQDYIYKSEDKWYVRKEVGKAELGNGSNWRRLNTGTTGEYRFSVKVSNTDIPTSSSSSTLVDMCSNYWQACTRLQTYQKTQGIATTTSTDIGVESFIAFVDSLKTSDVDGWKAWLTANMPVVYYPSTTPTDTEITNEALIAQLDNVASAPLYTGVNNITTITPNEQGTLEIKYVTYDKYNQNKVYIWNDTLQQWQIIVQ
jgi:hypothetical protein